jgi:hypothetical protein
MESYKSDVVAIDCNVETVYSKLSDPEVFGKQIEQNLDKLPQEARENLDKVKFDKDSISIMSPMGPIKLVVQERVAPTKIVFTAAQSPVAFNAVVNLAKVDEQHSTAITELQLDIPVFLRAMVGNKLEEGAKKFGEVLGKLPYDKM